MSNESRTKKSAINIGFNLLNQVVGFILSFVSRTIFIHVLGVGYLGINGLFSDVLNLLSMADLGFGTAMVYSFYKPLAENDYKKMAALTSFYKRVYRVIAVLVTVIGLVITPFLKYIVNMDGDIDNLSIYYLLSLAGVVISYLCVYKTSILTADQNNYIVTKISIIMNITKTIVQIVSLILLKNYIVYLIIGLVCNLLNNWFASLKASQKYRFIEKQESLQKSERKEIIDNIKSVFIYKVSSVLLNATDNIIISVVVGTVAVGYYSNYLMIQNKITIMYSLLFTSLTASIGNIIIKENAKKRYEIFQCEQVVSFIICGIIIPCYGSLINNFIQLWLGEQYLFSDVTIIAIALNLYLSCVLQPLWSYREATGLYRKTKWVMLCCAGINLILSFILGHILGVAGILLASGISRLVTYVWYEPVLLFKEYFNESSTSYFKTIIKNAILTSTMLIIATLLSDKYTAYSWKMWLIKACVVFGVCTICACLVSCRTEGFILVRDKVKKILSQFHKKKGELSY